jgi:hypothetical protein
MAISTYGITLMKGTKGTGTAITYAKLVDIKDFPDLGGAPEMIEVTTLSDSMQVYIEGIQSADALEFTANYTKADYETLTALKSTQTPFAVYFGTDGSEGKYAFEGYLSVRINGGGVNEAVGMTISIAPATAITAITASAS